MPGMCGYERPVSTTMKILKARMPRSASFGISSSCTPDALMFQSNAARLRYASIMPSRFSAVVTTQHPRAEPVDHQRDHLRAVLLVRRVVRRVPLHDEPLWRWRRLVQLLGVIGGRHRVVGDRDDHQAAC